MLVFSVSPLEHKLNLLNLDEKYSASLTPFLCAKVQNISIKFNCMGFCCWTLKIPRESLKTELPSEKLLSNGFPLDDELNFIYFEI